MGYAVPLAQIAPARLEDRLGSAGPPSRKFGELGFGCLWHGPLVQAYRSNAMNLNLHMNCKIYTPIARCYLEMTNLGW
jgi:hypothetical protein